MGNGDGYPDLAITQVLDGHTIHVMLNKPSSRKLPPTFVNPLGAAPSPVTDRTVGFRVKVQCQCLLPRAKCWDVQDWKSYSTRNPGRRRTRRAS